LLLTVTMRTAFVRTRDARLDKIEIGNTASLGKFLTENLKIVSQFLAGSARHLEGVLIALTVPLGVSVFLQRGKESEHERIHGRSCRCHFLLLLFFS
ncbi:hypothetical protein PFISCL1PPCAC_6470, partial [Pristionchus fissidentatus]